MTLHQFWSEESLDSTEVGQEVLFQGAEAKHALSVHRLKAGDRLLLSDGQGRVAQSIIRQGDPGGKNSLPQCLVRIEKIIEKLPSAPPLHLIQALAKGERDLAAIEMATELGVLSVTPWEAERSVARWPQAKQEKSATKWKNQLLAAAKQSRNPFVPQLKSLQNSRELARSVASLVEAGDVVFVLDEQADSLEEIAGRVDREASVHFIVGPEGGISQNELEAFREAGALGASLGSLILRASSAGPVALSTWKTACKLLPPTVDSGPVD